jgi:hypothetical protein
MVTWTQLSLSPSLYIQPDDKEFGPAARKKVTTTASTLSSRKVNYHRHFSPFFSFPSHYNPSVEPKRSAIL